ncbi:hypothetical protein B0H34DRAFT_796467 [Crassisporium funariophilum]|nr:hypothetical protein B0H34DRAFT_796467 [Crassisporium funariophilum]
MEHCPPEIWMYIFSLACTDTGHTGRALSLVSQSFNALSKPYKYQALNITSAKQLAAFYTTFSGLLPEEKKIRYLFVHSPFLVFNGIESAGNGDDSDFSYEGSATEGSDEDNSEDADDSSDSDCDGSLDSMEREDLVDDLQYFKAVADNHHADAVDFGELEDKILMLQDPVRYHLRAILEATSSSLTVLFIHWTSSACVQLHALLPSSLPCLEELHIHRLHNYWVEGQEDETPGDMVFPKLRRLYVAGSVTPQNAEFGKIIARIAPNLTYLRIPQRFSRWANAPPTSFLKTVPHNLGLKKLIIEKPALSFNSDETPRIVEMVFGQTTSPARVYIAKVSGDYISCYPDRWKEQWVDRVMGREGDWDDWRSSEVEIK